MTMKKKYSIKAFCSLICLLSISLIGFVPNKNPPEADISNGLIHAHLYLPDADNGYYRATRFDWSGVINDLEVNGHSYYGQWYEKYSPTINDAIMGPVEAFDPVGYDEINPGESFVKIGVGMVTKTKDLPYNFATYYPIVDGGKWNTKLQADQVQFEHILNGSQYAYDYIKTIKLVKNKPVMVLSHTLKNTGTKTILTSAFDHNFLVMDKQSTGPGFVVTLPLKPSEQVKVNMQDYAKLQDNQLIFLKNLDRKNVSFKDLTNGNGADYCLEVENHNTGAAVKITGDKRISKLVFWSASKTVCPEPYINIKVEPGKTFTWNITYEYYDCDITKTQ
jgi:hypothetical protein